MEPNKQHYSKKAFAYLFRDRGRTNSVGILEKSFSIIDYNSYKFYKENSKRYTKEEVENYVEHGKIISAFYKVVGEKIVEAKGGVFIEGLGYFGIIQEMTKKLSFNRNTGKWDMNPKTDNKIYNIGYVPITKDNIFKTWVFDYSFTRPLKKRFSEKLKSGMKYSFNASLFFDRLRKKGNDL